MMWGEPKEMRPIVRKILVGFPKVEKIIYETYEWVKGEGIIYNTDYTNRAPIKIEEFTPEDHAALHPTSYKMYLGEKAYNLLQEAMRNK